MPNPWTASLQVGGVWSSFLHLLFFLPIPVLKVPSLHTHVIHLFVSHTDNSFSFVFLLSLFSLSFLPSPATFASLVALENWLVYCWERGWCQEILTAGALSRGCDAGQDHVPDLGLVYFGSCSCCGAATSAWLLALLCRLHLLQAGILPSPAVPLSLCSKPLGSRGLGRDLRDSSAWKSILDRPAGAFETVTGE